MGEFFDITLRHIGGERVTLPVEYIAPNGLFLSVHWGQSGYYDLYIKENKLLARSLKARRKGVPHWAADDIALVRCQVKEWLDAKAGNALAEMRERIAKHAESMPKREP